MASFLNILHLTEAQKGDPMKKLLVSLAMISLFLLGCGPTEGLSTGTYRSQIYEPYQEAYQNFFAEKDQMSREIANYLAGDMSPSEVKDLMMETKEAYSEIISQYDAIETRGLGGEETKSFSEGIGKLKEACVEGQKMTDYVLSILESDPPYPPDPTELAAITDAMEKYEYQGLRIMEDLDESHGIQ